MPASSEQGREGPSGGVPGGFWARFGRAIGVLTDIVAVAGSVAVTGLMSYLVVARYLLNWPIVGLEELIMLAAMPLYMFGALIASRRRQQLTVEWLANLLERPRAQAVHDLLIGVLTAIVTVFFIVWAWDMFAWGMQRPQWTPAYRVPMWVAQAPIGLAAGGCFLYALRDIVGAILRLKET